MAEFTRAQKAALNADGCDILVSAAAGSGKTTTLTERIVRRVISGQSLDRVVISTFSRASADDMRVKITDTLRRAAAADPSNRHIERQLASVGSMHLGTIHSFCYDLIKHNSEKLGLPAKLRVLDESESKLLTSSCMAETVDEFYRMPAEGSHDPESDFLSLADHLAGGGGDGVIENILLSLYIKTVCLPDKYRTLLESARELECAAGGKFLSSSAGKAVAGRTLRGLEYYKSIFAAAADEYRGDEKLSKTDLPNMLSALDVIGRLEKTVGDDDYGGVCETLASVKFDRFGTFAGEKPQRLDFMRKKFSEFKDFLTKIRDSFFSSDSERLDSTLMRTASVIKGIVRVLDAFEGHYADEKRRRGVCDFNDLEHYALTLLSDEETASAVADTIDEIYLDECQDCNAVQDRIFSLISRKNRFMVGDVKQSIYGFRGADPSIFDSYRRRFDKITDAEDAAYDNGVSVFMSENFRCSRPIIDVTNAVCGRIMKYGNVSYEEDDALRCGKDGGGDEPPIEIVIAPKAEDEGDRDEIDVIADEVADVLVNKRNADGERYKPSDIAILLRSVSEGVTGRIADALRARGIQAEDTDASNLFGCPEILLVLSILHVIDNPLRDIYLAGALRSPVFGFTLDDLVRMKKSDKRPLYNVLRERAEDDVGDALAEKCRYAIRTISEYRELARSASSDEIISYVYRKTGIESMVWAEVNGNIESPPAYRAENLSMLYDIAHKYEAVRYRGLHRFLEYVDDMIADGVTNPAQHGEVPNAVRIMTVHHSKGLEFPVVILGMCGRARNERDLSSPFLYSREAGAAMKLRLDDEGRSTVVIDTLPRRAVAESLSVSAAAEEMRILYVGMTRARERLIITMTAKDFDKFIDNMRAEAEFFSSEAVLGSKSYGEWILKSLFSAKEELPYVIRRADKKVLYDSPIEEAHEDEMISESLVGVYRDEIEKRLSFRYPYEKLGSLPAKMTVSKLYPDVLDEDDEVTERNDAPVSEAAAKAAKAGTATHLFLQFCDFERVDKNGIDAEIEELLSRGFISDDDAGLIRRDELRGFFMSDLYRRMRGSDEVRREHRFNIRLPASEFTEIPENRELYRTEKLLVQGVIDCHFREKDGSVTLVDYKTDRLTREELADCELAAEKMRERHKRQLMYYREALKLIYGEETKINVLIFSLHASMEISI